MWDGMAQCIHRPAEEVLRVSRGSGGRKNRAWWWNEEVRDKVKEKQKACAAFSICTSEEEKGVMEVTYKVTKKIAKKGVTIPKNNAYERLYQRLETQEGEKDVCRLARTREKKARDLGYVTCIIREDGTVLVEKTEIQDRWRSYFARLLTARISIPNEPRVGYRRDI